VKWVRWASGEMSAHRATSTADPRPAARRKGSGSPRAVQPLSRSPSWVPARRWSTPNLRRGQSPGQGFRLPNARGQICGKQCLGAKPGQLVRLASWQLAPEPSESRYSEPRCCRWRPCRRATWISSPTQNAPTRTQAPRAAPIPQRAVGSQRGLARDGHAGAEGCNGMGGNRRRTHHPARFRLSRSRAAPARPGQVVTHPGFHHRAAISALAIRRSTRCPFLVVDG